MNEKTKRIIISTIALFVFVCSGCKSLPTDSDTIAEYYRDFGRVEATTQNIGEFISSSREQIRNVREASDGIEDATERLIYLFSEYDRVVRELLEDLERLRSEIEEQSNVHNDSNNNSFNSDNN